VALVLTAYAAASSVVTLTWLAIFLPANSLRSDGDCSAGLLALGSILIGTLVLSLPLVLPARRTLHRVNLLKSCKRRFRRHQTDALALLVPTPTTLSLAHRSPRLIETWQKQSMDAYLAGWPCC